MSVNPKKSSVAKLQAKKQQKKASLPFTAENYYIFAAGLVVVLVGYVCLATPPVYGGISMTVAPILLCLGYLVIIPASLLYRKKAPLETSTEPKGFSS